MLFSTIGVNTVATIADLVKEYYGSNSSSYANKFTNQAKDACGFANTNTKQLSPEQFEAVDNWLKNDAIAKGKYSPENVEPTKCADDGALYAHETAPEPTQTDSTSVQAQTLTNSRATSTKSTNKMKDKAIRGVEAKLIHIRTPDNVRKAVWLEPVFYEALERVTATRNKDKWLTDILVNVGEGNLASAVRCSIVKELLT